MKVKSIDGLVKDQAIAQAPDGYAVTKHAFANPGHYIVKVERTDNAGVRSMNHLDVVVGEE